MVLGAGDDAAVWAPPAGRALAVTQDALVEDQDFTRSWPGPYLLGRRALVVSLCDLAAMGAQPAFCLVTFCAPPATQVDDVLAIQAGLCDEALRVGCSLLGGDVSRCDGPIVLDVVAGGTVVPGAMLRRDAGRAGDVLLVTGVLGRAAAGLRLLTEPTAAAGIDAADAERWRRAQTEPTPRLVEGRLAAEAGVRCGGDLSDGLLADAARTTDASGCAAELWLDVIPVDAALPSAFPSDWVELALGGGEDFELLLAVPPGEQQRLRAAWPAHLAPLTEVGRLTEGAGVRLLDSRGGRELRPPAVRARHFR